MDIIQELYKNFKTVKDKIDIAGDGREIKIVAASKMVDVSIIKAAYDNLDIFALGENIPQEFRGKFEAEPNLPWHMIGHLQSNKAKYVVGKVDLIHSLDRMSLAKEINRLSIDKGIISNVLVQVNFGKDLDKSGLYIEDTLDFIKSIKDNYKNINIQGLMGIAPKNITTQESIDLYKEFNDNYNKIKQQAIDIYNLDILSCGMSFDYEIAIKYGKSNMVRIGQAIFNQRKY